MRRWCASPATGMWLWLIWALFSSKYGDQEDPPFASKWEGVNAIEKAIFLIDAYELERHWLMVYRHQYLPSPL